MCRCLPGSPGERISILPLKVASSWMAIFGAMMLPVTSPRSRIVTQTLAWHYAATDGDVPWATRIDASAIDWDLDIFDNRALVCQERDLPDRAHTVDRGLAPCSMYRWSVRPVCRLEGDVRFGAWMRIPGPLDPDEMPSLARGRIGRDGSEVPAGTGDFQALETDCNRRWSGTVGRADGNCSRPV